MDRARTASRLAWTLGGVVLAIAATTTVFLVLGYDTEPPPLSFGFRAYGVPLALVFVAAGIPVASRVPSNPIGWILIAAGAGTAIQELAQQYAIYGVLDSPGAVPGAEVAAWIPEWVWIPFMAGIALYVPLLFPDGHLPSRRWVWVAIAGSAGATIGAVGFALVPGPLESFPVVRNPVGVEGSTWIGTAADVAMLVFVMALFSAVVSLVIRARRSRGDERQQLRWLALPLVVLGLAFLIGVPYWTLSGQGGSLDAVENIVVLGLAGVPVAIGFATLKYRLYDIDLVIKKTVVYGVLAALLFALGGAAAWTAGGLVFTASGQREYSWLLAGVVVGAALWPLRRIATRVADRVVYGRRATPYEVLSEFSGRVAETYAADDVLQRMAQVLGEAVGAEEATVWLGAGDRTHAVATWPGGTAIDAALPDTAIEVRHQGVVLGALSVRMPVRDPMTPARERLIRDLAGQAGLVLRNAALIDDLKTSRQRLVAAQDQERRRLERNIHDGAQQQLVALAVKLSLAERTLASDPGRVGAMLAEAKDDTNDALETLRDLARGIYPPLLADEGLAAALTAQARKSAVPVSIETDGIGRYPQEAEAAVYFSCLEALQNVAKHAGATSATIRLGQDDGHVTFEVVDDGHGFDPTASTYGSGLQGIADRLAALGGEVTIRSTPGGGTTVAGRLPIAAARS
jgi:signal transduction histidine kinase